MTSRCLVVGLVAALAAVGDAGAGCGSVPDADVHRWSASPLRLERASKSGVESLDPDSHLLLVAKNGAPDTGELTVDAAVLSDRGMGPRPGVATAIVEGGARTLVPIPVSDLELPSEALRFSGVISFTASINYPDGRVENASPFLELFFHPEGDGWLVYGEEERREVFAGGVLAATDRARGLGGRDFGTAFSRRVAEDTRWRPEGDDPVSAGESKDGGERATVKICIEQYSAFTDSGVGEDYWQSSSSFARASRGAWVGIWREGTANPIWADALGDGRGAGDPGSGCTEELSLPDPAGTYDYSFQIFTMGNVQGNVVNSAYDGGGILDWSFTRSLTGSGTHVVTFDPTYDTGRTFDVYMVGAYCQYRHPGGVSGETYPYRLMQSSSDSWVYRGSDTIMIGEDVADKKFIIAHETGHLVGDYGTGNNDWKTVQSMCECYNSTSCPTPDGQGSHLMISKERSRCAVAEGFAHFYSAAVFNWHGIGHFDCSYHYYKSIGGDDTPIVDCDEANGPFDVQYMESNCASPWSGMGTELDWMRTFWDMLSANPAIPGDPTLEVDDILAWFDSAEYWHNYDAYKNLDAAADLIGGDLDAHWDWFAAVNGIDWPRSGLLFVDGFESGKLSCWSDH
jgi:hypothetical protein